MVKHKNGDLINNIMLRYLSVKYINIVFAEFHSADYMLLFTQYTGGFIKKIIVSPYVVKTTVFVMKNQIQTKYSLIMTF